MMEIPGGHGTAIRLHAGRTLRLVNTFGSQVVDTWGLALADPTEYLSVEHTRRLLGRLFPREGDVLFSNRRQPLLMLERDTSGCRHDMLFACCDPWLYRHYGAPAGHRSCHQNFLEALAGAQVTTPHVPDPVNFWMNVTVSDNERLSLEPPVSRPGDSLVLRARTDVLVVFSACPMDITPVNGADRTPRAVHYELLD
jgi:uncharacterized protein YcgI (DUF1989 family)